MNIVLRRIKKMLKPIYHHFFKNKIKIDELYRENEILRYQLEYMKHHFDIQQMKPATGWLREYQIRETKYALEVIKLMNADGIFPFFDSGSLLGAIRHKGFIPFDDDIDLGCTRADFDKIIELGKEKYIWIDTSTTFIGSFEKLVDDAIKNNPNKYCFIRTPFCMHVYKGTSLHDALNCEFFPYDYVQENVSESMFKQFIDNLKNKSLLSQPWGKTFDLYEQLLASEIIFTRNRTAVICPGLNNYVLTQYNFLGFRKTEDVFPLTTLLFEGEVVPVPHKPEQFISKTYSSYKDFPKDVGISHTLEVLNKYLITQNNSIPFKEIYE